MGALAPQLAVAGTLMGVLALGAFRKPSRTLLRWLGAVALLLAAALLPGDVGFGPLLGWDGMGRLWNVLFFAGAIPLLAVAPADDEIPIALILGSVLGMSLLAVSRNLIGLFLGLELMSLPAYLLVWSLRRSAASLEAAVKYFFAGGAAGALFVLGAALTYAGSGSLALVPAAAGDTRLGLALMAAAALFKMGAFPLHFWLPDVYEAARPELAGFLSTSMKAAAVLLLMRLAAIADPAVLAYLPVVAGCTMTVGNVLALRQVSLQRLLAYSSIAHVGYLLTGISAWVRFGTSAPASAFIWFYLASYLAASTGAFLVLRLSGLREVRQLKGLGARSPALAGFLSLFLISLAGFPPTAGFLAKFMIFWDALNAQLVGLVVLASLNTLLGMAYYFRLIRAMYFEEPEGAPAAPEPAAAGTLLLAACALPTVVFGLYPGVLFFIADLLRN